MDNRVNLFDTKVESETRKLEDSRRNVEAEVEKQTGLLKEVVGDYTCRVKRGRREVVRDQVEVRFGAMNYFIVMYMYISVFYILILYIFSVEYNRIYKVIIIIYE